MENLSTYDKPYSPPKELVTSLRQRGMIIADDEYAENFLKTINYYRFKVYFRPFISSKSNIFKENTTFEKAVQLYRFDDELRDFLFSIIGRLEVKIRTRLDQIVTAYTKNPFWYMDAENFKQYSVKHINDFNAKFIDSKDDFVKHYKDHYKNSTNISYPQMPPFWMMAELTTFGDILGLFKKLNKEQFQTKKGNALDDLANEFGASSLDILNSWLISIRETRNRCAHHSRVWNRNCVETKGIQGRNSRLQIKPNKQNKLYTALFVIHHMSCQIGIERNVKDEFLYLLEKYPEVKKFLGNIGFPRNWNHINAWKI